VVNRARRKTCSHNEDSLSGELGKLRSAIMARAEGDYVWIDLMNASDGVSSLADEPRDRMSMKSVRKSVHGGNKGTCRNVLACKTYTTSIQLSYRCILLTEQS
jgi:hypothetical protein